MTNVTRNLPYMGARHKYEISTTRVGVSRLVIQTQPRQPGNVNQLWLKTDFGRVPEQSLNVQDSLQNTTKRL